MLSADTSNEGVVHNAEHSSRQDVFSLDGREPYDRIYGKSS